MDGIAGKVVALTGASGGIGEATPRLLASQGAKLVLGARRTDRLETIAGAIREAGGEADIGWSGSVHEPGRADRG